MKTSKLIMAIVVTFLSINFAFAGNPNKKDFTENLAINIVKHLCKDIHLTDSQRIVIQLKATEYEVKMKNLIHEKDPVRKKSTSAQGIREFRTLLNNTLTKEQLDTLRLKRIKAI